jgi:glycerol-3-phosphate dehydrogenase (NAD(P)+)
MAKRPAPAKSSPAKKSTKPVISILGIGQMGLVCAGLLAAPDKPRWDDSDAPPPPSPKPGKTRSDPNSASALPHDIILWGHNADEAGELAQTRRSPRLPGFKLPESVRVSFKDADAVREASLIVSAVPVQFSREAWYRLRKHIPEDASVVSVAKGIENDTLLRPTQVIADVLEDDPDAAPRRLGVLSGPTIASELAKFLPATMIAASDDIDFAKFIQRLFSTSWLRVYTNPDMLGVELAGATKNIIAIAAGVLDGLKVGYNAKSALLARGLAEIARLGTAMGANSETFFGIAGVGDLATSCFSPEGRNRSCGEALGRGEKIESYLKRTPSVVEGVATTRSVMDLSRKFKVEMPITAAVNAVLFEKVDPIEAIGRLMSRELKGERVG